MNTPPFSDGHRLTYFISDLHLGAAYITDHAAHERRVVQFLRSIEHNARRLFLVGDILDYWFEYRTVVPRGYIRFFGQLARMADEGVEITWLIGNHDIWLFDYLRDQIGMTVLDGTLETTLDGTRFFIAHGDGLGQRTPAFRAIRAVFRNRVCQKLYSAIHPRWTIPFAHGWSKSSRESSAPRPDYEERIARSLTEWAAEFFSGPICSRGPLIAVLGHHHILLDRQVSQCARLVVLGDWISHNSYAVWDGKNIQLCQFESN